MSPLSASFWHLLCKVLTSGRKAKPELRPLEILHTVIFSVVFSYFVGLFVLFLGSFFPLPHPYFCPSYPACLHTGTTANPVLVLLGVQNKWKFFSVLRKMNSPSASSLLWVWKNAPSTHSRQRHWLLQVVHCVPVLCSVFSVCVCVWPRRWSGLGSHTSTKMQSEEV